MNKLAICMQYSALFLGVSSFHAPAGDTLIFNGKVASTGMRTIDGSAYVKLADVAKALDMVVVKRPDGKYELTKAGGANQVQGAVQGKIGDVLFDGKWRFQVLSVQTPDSYTMKTPGAEASSYPADTLNFNRTTQVVSPKSGYKLIVVNCRMSNGQKTTQTFWLGHNDVNNALADADGESNVPVGYDLEGAPIQSKPLLPGAKKDFAMLFIVPEATKLKDLIFTLRNNESGKKGSDVRVSLITDKEN